MLLVLLAVGSSLNIYVSENGKKFTGVAAFVRYYHVECADRGRCTGAAGDGRTGLAEALTVVASIPITADGAGGLLTL